MMIVNNVDIASKLDMCQISDIEIMSILPPISMCEISDIEIMSILPPISMCVKLVT